MIPNIRRLVPTVVRRNYALKFGLILLLMGISVGAIGFVATGMVTDSVETTALQDQESQATQEASAIDNWQDDNERFLSSTASTPAVQADDRAAIDDYLVSIGSDLPEEADHLLYVDTATGDVLADAGGSVDNIDDLDMPAEAGLEPGLTTQQVQRTAPYEMVDVTAVGEARKPAITYYVGTGDGDRALVMSVLLSERTTVSTSVPSVAMTALDEEGRIVADDAYLGTNLDRSVFHEPYGNDALVETARQEGSGAMFIEDPPSETLQAEPYSFSPDGYVVGFDTTEDGWLVLVHATETRAFGFVSTVDQYGTMATFGSVLLIGLLGAVLGRSTAVSIDRLREKVAQLEDGDLDVEFETKRIDNIGRLYEGFGSMRDKLKARIVEAEDAKAEAERERERVQSINEDLQGAAVAYGETMETAAAGDLTVRMDPEASDNKTMQTIATDFNEMLAEIEATVAGLNRFATDVAIASEQVTASSEEVRAASAQVSESVQEIADGADNQFGALQSIDDEMRALSTTTEAIAASSNEVADVAEQTAQAGRAGRDAATAAIDACEQLEQDRETVVAEFERLSEEVGQVDDLIDRIAEIAEQTNMLALNANIEASRSVSEDDEGFNVVAAEVKELSADVKDLTEEIDQRLEGIKTQTERSAAEVEHTSEEIERVTDLATNAAESLEEIADYAGETNDGVQEISAATEQQAASTQEVVAMIDEVATIAEETTTESENVAASAEEQTSAITEVSRSADTLSGQAVSLSDALDRFETDPDEDSVGVVTPEEVETVVESAGSDTGTSASEIAGESSENTDERHADGDAAMWDTSHADETMLFDE